MLKVACPDGIDLKFLDESVVYTVEDGVLTLQNSQTKEVLIQMDTIITTDEASITT